jgi:basic membrane protein A
MHNTKPSTTPLLRLLALLAALAMLAAACGSDDEDDATEETETSEESTADGDSADDDSTDDDSSDDDAAGDDAAEDEADDAAVDEAVADTVNVVTVPCGDGSSFATPDAPVTDLTVALVAPSASNDFAFTQSMVDSLGALGIEPQVTDGTFVVEEAAAAIRGYAEDGIDVIIAHGTQYGGSLEEIAPDFPETAFVWGTSSDTKGIPNVFAYTPAADEGGYVLGVVAAQLSESEIGMVGPIEAGDAALYVEGFSEGSASAGVDTSVVYTGSFGDVALATEAAEAFVATGVDVMTGTAQHVVGAIAVADREGMPWFGTQSNQTPLAEDLVVASQVYHWEVALADIFTQIEGGVFGGEVYTIDLANGGLIIEFNGCSDLATDELKALAQATVADVIAG